MTGHLPHVMTLANSIIGVSVLAMPFCFKQCGIVLATLVLLMSSVLSRLACHFLIKSAVMSRRRNYEFLAFHAFGRTGKFLVELFIIGFLVGTCIAFFVVVGDLGPQIVGKMLNKEPEDIRTSLLVTTGTFIVFPLGLLRNIDSLSSVCTATIGFYLCLVIKVIAESARHIFLGDWYDHVNYWRPAGILQCLPIFAMALFCQTQLFEIYEAIPNVCLDKMNRVVRGALNICTIVYLCVGFFGYVAFCTQPFTGNILMSFEPSLTSDLIKIGFVFSVAFSFPLVIFPCRASLNSLLFRRAHTHEPSNYYIPEMRFRCLTLTIVALSLGTGILMPNIEFVLGIVGSTIGVMICLIFPAAFFIAISTKNTNERLIAQAILFFGMWIMVLGTYANLYAMDESSSARLTTEKPLYRISDVITLNGIPREGFPPIRQLPKDIQINQEPNEGNIEMPQQQLHKDSKDINEAIDVRREPPIPVERAIITEKSSIETRISGVNLVESSTAKLLESSAKTKGGQVDVPSVKIPKPQEVENAIVGVEKREDEKGLVDERKDNLIDSDAIKKEESELAAAGNLADVEPAGRIEKLEQTLKKHKLEQMKMMQEQKELLKDIKEQKQELEMEKKRLAEEQRKKNNDAREERISKFETIDEEKTSILRNNHEVNNVDHQLLANQNGKDETLDKSSNLRSNHENNRQLDQIDNRLVDTPNENDKKREKLSNSRSNPEINYQVDREDPRSVNAHKENEKPLKKSEENQENVQQSVIIPQEIPNANNLESPLVESDNSRGPILNALTNWTSKRNSSINEDNRDAKIGETLPKKAPLEFALPIALQMRDPSKESPEKKLINASNTDSEAAALQRDILDRADRLKREATENSNEEILNVPIIPEALPAEAEKSVDIQTIKKDPVIDREQCRQADKNSENFILREETSVKTKQETSSESPSTITIKSLVYLAEQRFTDKILAVDPNNVNVGAADLPKLKKRDLKALSSEQ